MAGHGTDNLVLCVLEGIGDDAGAGLEVVDLRLTGLDARELGRAEDASLAVGGRRDLCRLEAGDVARAVDKVESTASGDGAGGDVAEATQNAARRAPNSHGIETDGWRW